MKQQNLRRLFRKEGLKVGHALFEFNTPGIGQILNVSGVDFVFLDMEHSGFGMMETKQLIAYLRAGDLPVLVRPPSKSYHHIARVLDVGADGVMLPMVANASEARQALTHLRYPPQGHRGVAIGIAHDGYAPAAPSQTLAAANRRIAMAALIETAEGVDDIDNIAATPGVDCLWLGHFDLSASLGVPGQFEHPAFVAAERKIRQAATRHSKALGFLVTDADQGAKSYARGYDVICYQLDVGAYRDAMTQGITQLRFACAKRKPRSKDSKS